MQFAYRIAFLLAGLLAFCVANAQTTPANFGSTDEEKHLLKVFRMPETRGEYTYLLSCYVQVEKKGKLKEMGCINSTEAEYAIHLEMEQAAKKARMVPAMIDGKPRGVYVQFRVQFVGKEGENKAYLFLNPAEPENVEAYGDHHVAAQRVIGKEPWQKICPTSSQWLIHSRSHMSVEGKASSVELQHGGGIRPTGSCVQSIISTLESSEYIPTLVDGVAVPSVYIEGFGH
jgi:hypothetical protein